MTAQQSVSDRVEDIAVEDGAVTIETDLTALDGDTSTEVDRAKVEAFDHVVAVASAKGGVGKSTVATNLACALADDADVALFDADVHGPNVPSLLDISGPISTPATRATRSRSELRAWT